MSFIRSNGLYQLTNVVFDLDGTLVDHKHRVHLVQGKNKNYAEFYKQCVNDVVIDQTALICNLLYSRGNRVIILTGRSDEVREETVDYLLKWDIRYHELHMRPAGDHRLDTTFKAEMAAKLGLNKDNTLCVFEDRKRVVEMWRAMGITCYQVADGDF